MKGSKEHKRSTHSRPQVVDLFSGAGGFSLGFEQAGFDITTAVEIDPIHAATHHYNFPQCYIFSRSITSIRGEDILKTANLTQNKPIVVIGGAPCQGFSLIGQRALDDPRNSLVRDFIRIVRELDADYFVFENVKGLTVGKHKNFLKEILESFQSAGYRVRAPWKVLNAANYGVPQNRERLILFGAKKGLTLPKYPEIQTAPPKESLPLDFILKAPTCKEAIDDVPNADTYPELQKTDEVIIDSWKSPSAYAANLRCSNSESWHFGYRRIWNCSLLTSSMQTKHTDITKRRFSETYPGQTEPISRFYKLAPNGISNTLRAGTDSARGAFTSPRPIHYKYDRCITVREMARLHGYPDWFRFHQTKWHGARQIGNSVPPPLARSIASQIVAAMGIATRCPEESIELGQTDLLRFTASEAAKYWGVDNPIKRRDRKNGTKKRSQLEVEADRMALREASHG